MAEFPATIGRYQVVSRLGQGGMGSLYLARDPKIGRLVAIKLVRQEFDSPEARQRFAREAQSAGTLRHPNIVTIFDVDEHDGLPFIAMEYVEGETLSEIVRRKARVPVPTKLLWIEELCAGLAYAHRQGVVHRDVKPSNLMLDKEGALKILDFGLARREASKFTQSQAIIGTPHYMSPEQVRAGDVGPRSDMFAVGAVLYELLAFTEAFPGSVHQAMHKIVCEEPRPLHESLPDVDPAIEAILARALRKDPAERFDDLSVMRAEIARVRQRLEGAAEATDTVALTTPVRTARRPGSGASGLPGAGSGSGSASLSRSLRESGTMHRQSLQKRRAAQIDAHLVEARRLYESGAFDQARQSLDQALMFDPDHPTGLQLLDEITVEEERQQIAQLLTSARAELQKGRLEAAEQFVAQAIEIAPQAPEVIQLRDTIETARREIERARQMQEALRRARARFAEGSYEGAIRAAGELLAIDPGHAAARDLQARANEAIDARTNRAARDSAAQAAVAGARALMEKGDRPAAIAALEAFTPPHDLVTGVLASLRAGLDDDAADVSPPVPVAAPSVAAPTSSPPRRRAAYAVAASAIVIAAAAGVYKATRTNVVAPATASAAPASQPSAAPAAIVPAKADDRPPSESARPSGDGGSNDRDAMDAYRLLASGRRDEAAAIVARIARRDPANRNLADLRAQIQAAADRQRAAVQGSDQGQGTPPATPLSTAVAAPRVEPPPASPAVPAAEPPPAPKSAADVERPAIEAAIADYAKALSAKDLPAVARVRRYTPAEARSWENIFKQFSEYRLIVKVTGVPAVDGDRARVPVEETFAQTAKKGGIQVFSQPRKTEYLLEKIGGKWMILPPS